MAFSVKAQGHREDQRYQEMKRFRAAGETIKPHAAEGEQL